MARALESRKRLGGRVATKREVSWSHFRRDICLPIASNSFLNQRCVSREIFSFIGQRGANSSKRPLPIQAYIPAMLGPVTKKSTGRPERSRGTGFLGGRNTHVPKAMSKWTSNEKAQHASYLRATGRVRCMKFSKRLRQRSLTSPLKMQNQRIRSHVVRSSLRRKMSDRVPQRENLGSPSIICKSSFGVSPLFHKSARDRTR